MSIDFQALPRQLRYWSIHCVINALPSFVIACVHLDLWQNPDALKAMGAAVLAFILVYSLLTSIRGPLTQSDHVLSRAIRAGAKFRMMISIFSTPFAPFAGAFVCVPDLWCGAAAIFILTQLLRLAGGPLGATPLLDRLSQNASFNDIFTIAIIQGMIISMLFFTISFFALLFIQRRERMKMYAAGMNGCPSNE
jgi:hypothetical protein